MAVPAGLCDAELRARAVAVRLYEIDQLLLENPNASIDEAERSALVQMLFYLDPRYHALVVSDDANDASMSCEKWKNRHVFGEHAAGSQLKDVKAGSLKITYVTSGSAGTAGLHSSSKVNVKVWIPHRQFPEINFVGLLIGPRGRTLKKMEQDTGVRISIRGKGSLRDGKMAYTTDAAAEAANEDLHALVMADTAHQAERAIAIIERVVSTATSIPEEANSLKRNQLRELAALNGTLRDDEAIVCGNCGEPGHRRFECQQQRNITTSIVCRICNGAGHLASDCKHRDDPQMVQQSEQMAQQMDSAYHDFLADIQRTI